MSISEAVGSGLRLLGKAVRGEGSQAAMGRRHGWEDRKHYGAASGVTRRVMCDMEVGEQTPVG